MTAEQRRQVIDFSGIRGTGMPIPMGTIPASSRAHIQNLYFIIPAIVPTVYFWRNKNLLSGVWSSRKAPTSTWSGRVSSSTNWAGKKTPQDGTTQEI